MSTSLAIEVCGLSVRLSGKPILKGVNLEVRRGDLYGLLGRNGAGKTTAMRCLLGYLPFQGGSCKVLGVHSARIHRVAQPYGVALDPPGMDDTLTLRQNLEVAAIRGGIVGGRGVDEALELVGLTHRQNNRGDRLSHGQGRRAAVARALLGSPELLVLDEPLSGLDPEGVERMLALFAELTASSKVTIVLSSHHLREVEHVCNRVGMMEEGMTLLEGQVPDLLAAAGDGLRLRAANLKGAAQMLARLPGVLPDPVLEGDILKVRVDSSFQASAALTQLVQAGFGIEEFARQGASLVDVFHRVLETKKNSVEDAA
mgnify:CR=1 FL=1|jgi:ABC-type multidrug transport system ATPase subunit